MGKQWKQWQTLFSWAPKSLQMVTAAMKLKDTCSLERKLWPACCCCWVASVVSDSVRPRRRQTTILPHPWDSPGKNTGVDCHFLLHPYMTIGKPIALTRRTFVIKVMSLLFNMLSRLVIAFLPGSKCLLISWLQSPPELILEPRKIKSVTVSTFYPSILAWMLWS